MTLARTAGAAALVCVGQVMGVVLHPDLRATLGAALFLVALATGAYKIGESS